MSDKCFIIPKRDEDLYAISENFCVERTEVDQSEVEENLNDYLSNISQWYDILEYFPQFFQIITNPNLICKELMLRSIKALTSGFSRLSDTMFSTLPDFLAEETPDERIVINITRIRSALPAYLYLLSRLSTHLEAEVVKSNTNVDKKGKNTKEHFYDDVAKARKQLIIAFENLLTRKEGNTSSVQLLYSPAAIPEGIPRVVSIYISKLLSVPENGFARSEMRQLFPSFFQILGFIGYEWNLMKAVVTMFLDKIHTWEYFKKCTSFIFLPFIVKLDSIVCENFLDAILNYFKAVPWSAPNSNSTDKVRPFSLFTSTLAETHPDFVVKNFQSFYKFLRCDQHLIRCATLSAMEAVIVYFLRQNTQDENYEFIFKVFNEIQFFFWDPSSYVRIRAATVCSHIICEHFLDDEKEEVVGDRTKRRFSTDFYAYNVIEKYALLLSDPLVSVRKNAVAAINDILHRNPFGHNLDFTNIIAKYHAVVEEKENIEEVPDNDDAVVAKLSERYGKYQSVVEEAVAEFFDLDEIPLPFEDPPNEDVEIAHYIDLAERMEKEDDKKAIAFEAVKFCVQCGRHVADRDFSDQIVEFVLTKFHMRNMANMDGDTRTEFNAEEQRLRIARKKDDLIRKEHDILCIAQFTLQMEECMKNASIALKHAQMAEINEIVKFLAGCRQFKLRNSESAVMQICSLIYRNDAEIRDYVVTAGKNIFFSGNINEAVSEKSTVQNLMQVMIHAKLEDRCVLSDTLVFIFESEKLKQGSLNYLWETAEKNNNFQMSIVAVQILQPYVKAVPSEGRKNFGRLAELLKRRHDLLQVEVLRLATYCVSSINPAKAKLAELTAPRFRIPSSDNFFLIAVKQLIDQITISKSPRWNQRAKLTFQCIFSLCESPDEFSSDIIGSVLCYVKEVTYKFRTFRHLYKESQKLLGTLRKKLLENNIEIVPSYSTENEFELHFAQLDAELQNLAINSTQENIALDTTADLNTSTNDTVLVHIDPTQPNCYKNFRRFMNIKKRRMKNCPVSWKAKELKWLQKNGDNSDMFKILKAPKECSIKHVKQVYEQSNELFLKARELHHQWHILLKRLFFLTQQYIVRSIAFVHETMTDGLETVTAALTELRKTPRGQISMLNLPEWTGEHLAPFERDNLADLSIFKSNQGRIADATEQSVDSVISAQVEAAIGYDWFRPGSILIRVFPLIMQTIRFRSRPLISGTLADSAVYCLIKFMLASPNVCRRNISFIFYYLRNAKPETRSNIIIMLADIAIRHPSSFSKQLKHYLLPIYDINPNVRYTSLLMIHYLYTVKAIQIPGQLRAHLAILLIDSNKFISDMAKHFFHEVIVNHHIQISSVINDVIIRLYALKIQDFDFAPIIEFFFGFMDTVKESDLTMHILCKHLVAATAFKETEDEYDSNFATQLVACMKLIPKISLYMVSTLDKTIDKFKFMLKKKKFHRIIVELTQTMHKKANAKPDIKNEIESLKKHINSAHRTVFLSSRYHNRTMATTTTSSRAGTVEPHSNDTTTAEPDYTFFKDDDEVTVEPMQID